MERESKKLRSKYFYFSFSRSYRPIVPFFSKREKNFSFTARSIFRIMNNSVEETILGIRKRRRKESRIFVDQDRIRTSLLARLLWTMFYVTYKLKHPERNAILFDPTSYSSVATDAATYHVLMNVFARNRNTYPSSPTLEKGTREGTFYFLVAIN